MRRPDLAPGPLGARTRVHAPVSVTPPPPWDDAVLLDLPDEGLARAIDLARANVADRQVLQPRQVADGAARLATRLAVQDPDDDRLTGILGVLRSRVSGGMVRDGRGRRDPGATALLGCCECAQGDPRAWERVAALAEAVAQDDPEAGGPEGSAALLAVVSPLLASNRRGDVVVLPVLPDDWFGQDVTVRGLPMAGGGRVSWSVTWPDDWPLLRWATSVPGHRITAPGLLPGWSDRHPKGLIGVDQRL